MKIIQKMQSEEIKKIVRGDIIEDEEEKEKYAHDASLFSLTPSLVVAPKDTKDIEHLIRYVKEAKKRGEDVSLTARAAGTDMTGGPLSESIVLDFTKYFTRIKEMNGTRAVVEPGIFYRDFEKETLKYNALMPSYPASRELCALGGMVANNAGGEKTIAYGKTADYVVGLKAVLSDGKEYVIEPLTESALSTKMTEDSFEGECYRKIFRLIQNNYDAIQRARPVVHKNSSGYNLWDVWDKKRFDLTKLFVGSQGTLGLITEITFRLVPQKPHKKMCIVFLDNLGMIPKLVDAVLSLKPSSIESFDGHTFKLALKFFRGFLKTLGARNTFSLLKQFLPELFMVMTKGIPQLTILIEFEDEYEEKIQEKIKQCTKELTMRGIKVRELTTKEEMEKYWVIRRESFNLLRHKVKNKKAAPFIDDIIVRPEYLPEFLLKLYVILEEYHLLYTIAGHIGDGNFHIIPLIDMQNKEEYEKIPEIMDKVYECVFQYRGSMSAEHNDGLIRTRYLETMYGKEIYALFKEVKNIFDPENIFNPNKKIEGKRYPFARS